LTPAQAQQIALARLIIADPHTLVLDEATSLIDPRTARSLEGSMSALLDGRTVVAIAHRLHTAHDADRIAVVIDGRIVELGSHHELVDADGGPGPPERSLGGHPQSRWPLEWLRAGPRSLVRADRRRRRLPTR
jgi:energy-coupling factor transporter ATP-binding protein EcfA2